MRTLISILFIIAMASTAQADRLKIVLSYVSDTNDTQTVDGPEVKIYNISETSNTQAAVASSVGADDAVATMIRVKATLAAVVNEFVVVRDSNAAILEIMDNAAANPPVGNN